MMDRLIVRLPSARVDALAAHDIRERWDPGLGRRIHDWLALGPEATDDRHMLAAEARDHVASGEQVRR